MKKLILSIVTLGNFILSYAQAPEGYYNSATGTGYTLKTQLYQIIKGHQAMSYGNLWTLYTTNPQAYNDNWYDPTDSNKILDVYSENPNGPDPYTYTPGTNQCGNYNGEGVCYNREHIIPQSVFSQSAPMVTDAFHIWPTDGYVNGRRDSYPFGVVNSPTWTSQNGSKLGSNYNSGYSAGYSGTVFEPIDEFKGDFARAHFYFATRYQENNIQNWNYPMFNGTKDKVFTDTFLRILMTWHVNDPVSPREIALNNAIYSVQNNRNPFIDHPEFAQQIWGDNLASNEFEYQERDQIKIFKKNKTTYTVKANYNNRLVKTIYIFTIEGKLIKELHNNSSLTSIDVSIDIPGLYIIKVLGINYEINRKIVI